MLFYFCYFYKRLMISALIIGLTWLTATGCAQTQPPLDTRLQIHMAQLPAPDNAPTPAGSETGPESGEQSAPSANDSGADRKVSAVEPLRSANPAPMAPSDPRQLFNDTPSITVAADVLPLPEFIHRVFGNLLKVNYVLSDRVTEKEKVSLNLNQQVSHRQLFETTCNMLEKHNVHVRVSDGIFYIEPIKGSLPLTLGMGNRLRDVPTAPGYLRQVIPLRYVKPENVTSVLLNLPDVQIGRINSENALLVTGTRDGLTQVMQFLSILDRPAMRGRYAAVARLTYRSPAEAIDTLKQTLTIEGIPVATRAEDGGLHLVPLETANMVAIFAAERQWLDRAQYWIEWIDKPADADERRFFIYEPQNSHAVDLLETLSQILGLSQEHGGKSSQADQKLKLFHPASTQGEKPEKQSADVATLEAEAATAFTDGKVRLSADTTRNVLVVYAPERQYKSIEDLLKRLDVMPPQVLIEATVAEVMLVDDLQFGLEWYLKNTSGEQTTTAGTLGGLGLGSTGFNLTTVLDSEKFNLLINALAKEELVQVLSSPRITVRDGNEASISVGTQVPVVTSETASVDDLTGVVRTYQYRTTGITLKLTPTVHARDVVTMEVEQEVSEPSASGGENPLILNRTLSTNVVATSGQTLAIGGLIKESKGVTNTSVPFLGKLPLIGNLFKSTNRGGERTELVVLITPHIIRSTQQADALRDLLLDRFSHLNWDTE